MQRRGITGTSCNVKCCMGERTKTASHALPMKDRMMSQQLTISSLFCVLALAGLCVVTSARDLSGTDAPVLAEQAELASGLLQG